VGFYEVRQIEYSLTEVDGIFDAPVLLHGSLNMHWKAKSADCYHWIIVFDIVAESFRHMRPPAVNTGRGAHLLDMGGKLAAGPSA
jgi:hypothetical protein